MDKMFDEFRRVIAIRRDEEQKTRQTLEIMQSKEHLFDEEDSRVVANVLAGQQSELSLLESEFRNLQELYQKEVVELENLLHEKEQVLRDIDKSLGAISNQAVLRHHFGKKQAALHRTLQEVKLNLCVRTKRSQEVSAAIANEEGDGNSSYRERDRERRSHHHHHGGSSSSRRGRDRD